MRDALLRRGYGHTVASVAAQLAAVATPYNWQGNARIAEIMRRHVRTVQRARARLEADGMIRSRLLLTGDLLEGQRSPVRHPQVVRDVSRLQRLARVRTQQRSAGENPSHRRRRPSAAHVPTAQTTRASAEDLQDLAGKVAPEFASFIGELAAAEAARARKPPPEAAPKVEPSEIDDWDRRTAELERELERKRQGRGPPQTN